MSYDKKIGFFLDPSNRHKEYLRRMGVAPVKHDLKSLLPEGAKEPEPKIWLPRKTSFFDIRNLITQSSNAFIIPGQFWTEKFPLVSILTDTREHGYPSAKLDAAQRSLRLRYEVDPRTGAETQYDFNEKSALSASEVIGGLPNRDEREEDFPLGVSFEEGYNRFVQKYRDLGDPAFSDQIPYAHHHVFGGYIAARTEYGFAVGHPLYPVLFVFEACEDIYDTYREDMCQETQLDVCEFEFEPKQIWGNLPDFAMASKEGFRAFLYSSMTQIRDHIAAHVPGALVNLKSKAENTKEHLSNHHMEGDISHQDLSGYYTSRIPVGHSSHFSPLQHALIMGHGLEKTLAEGKGFIANRCGELHYDKIKLNRAYIVPGMDAIGAGPRLIGLDDNYTPKKPEGLVVNFR